MTIYGTHQAKQIAEDLRRKGQDRSTKHMYQSLPQAGPRAGKAEDIRKAAESFDFLTCFRLLDPIDKKLASECYWAKGWDRFSSTLQPLMADLRDKILAVDWDEMEEG